MRYVFVAPHYCCIQWRIPFGYRIDLGAGSQQQLSHGHETIAGREVQGRPSAILPRIDVSILLDEPGYLCKVTVNRGIMQRSATDDVLTLKSGAVSTNKVKADNEKDKKSRRNHSRPDRHY